MSARNEHSWCPDLVFADDGFVGDTALTCSRTGKFELVPASEIPKAIRLRNRAAFPGLVNAHSHAFQRVIRGRTEHRSTHTLDSFWTWREQMYAAANKLEPEDIYAVSRMAFLEMALAGITCVGEFHYLHHAPDGKHYDDPNLLAKEVVRAARDVGLRITLLQVAYARSGYKQEENPLQARFIESSVDSFLMNVESLSAELTKSDGRAWTGIAPHSIRALPLDYLKQVVHFGSQRGLPIHMHVAEQAAEVTACIHEYGRSPVALLDTEGLLSEKFTAVHAIHVTPKAIRSIARAGASVCACPTTERNLGDGIVPADRYAQAEVPICLGTDSQTQIDLLEDARELEYHLRLQRTERNVLASADNGDRSGLARELFACATVNGAKSLGFSGGKIENGAPADFFTVDLDHPSVAGAAREDLLANIIFSAQSSAIRDVIIGGQRIVESGRHIQQDEIVEEFKKVQMKLWGP